MLACKGDTKALFNTVNGLVSQSKSNHMPDDKNSQENADTFSDFFHEKIKKIADVLETKPDYCPKI